MNELDTTLNDCLQNLKAELQFNQIEIGPLGTPVTIDFYEKWLKQKRFGSMTYLQDHFEIKKNPQKINLDLKTVITISQPYFPLVMPAAQKHPARVATYAQNNDYHFWLKNKLNVVINELQKKFPEETFLPYVDSGPILERNWAYQNQLGWFGKNTCLIHPKHGSLFFIAEILSSISPEKNKTWLEPLPDFCGTCTRCIDVCPTQALVTPKEMLADRCISYLTIESKETPSIELRPLIKDWFFGCDLCQTICPWNQKVFRQKKIQNQPATSTEQMLQLSGEEKIKLIDYFRWLLKSSHRQINKTLHGSALARAGAKGLKRNALIVIANRKIIELKEDVTSVQIAELAELKKWTLQQLT